MTVSVFLDTSDAIALASRRDQFHTQAVRLADMPEESSTQLVITRAVMLEIGNAISKERYRRAGIALLDSLEADPRVEVVPLSEELFARAVALFSQRHDKEWGLVDCVSIVVMDDRKIEMP
jgi:uncharacterized protein